MTYLRIWSKSTYGNLWLIERSETRQYAESLGIQEGHIWEMNGRKWIALPDNKDPNIDL